MRGTNGGVRTLTERFLHGYSRRTLCAAAIDGVVHRHLEQLRRLRDRRAILDSRMRRGGIRVGASIGSKAIDGAMAGGSFFGAAEVGPVNIGPEFFAFHFAASGLFDCRAILSRHPAPFEPVIDSLRRFADGIRKRALSAALAPHDPNCLFECIHDGRHNKHVFMYCQHVVFA